MSTEAGGASSFCVVRRDSLSELSCLTLSRCSDFTAQGVFVGSDWDQRPLSWGMWAASSMTFMDAVDRTLSSDLEDLDLISFAIALRLFSSCDKLCFIESNSSLNMHFKAKHSSVFISNFIGILDSVPIMVLIRAGIAAGGSILIAMSELSVLVLKFTFHHKCVMSDKTSLLNPCFKGQVLALCAVFVRVRRSRVDNLTCNMSVVLMLSLVSSVSVSVSAAGNGQCYISTALCTKHNEWSGYHDDSPFAVPTPYPLPNILFNA
jgi:hypothetical protein